MKILNPYELKKKIFGWASLVAIGFLLIVTFKEFFYYINTEAPIDGLAAVGRLMHISSGGFKLILFSLVLWYLLGSMEFITKKKNILRTLSLIGLGVLILWYGYQIALIMVYGIGFFSASMLFLLMRLLAFIVPFWYILFSTGEVKN